jgi:hypothetical protein
VASGGESAKDAAIEEITIFIILMKFSSERCNADLRLSVEWAGG